ncbi:MAG: transglutaminase-like domain-containing protein [Eubacterium sp.]|nr:transglutaminase-like domain-containing protein [Eubacterium sp.]
MSNSVWSQLNRDITLPGMKPKSKKEKKALSAWNREDRTPVKLCKGAEIDESVYDISENRYYTLILKGIIVYMITAGGLGSYLTAFDIAFNQVLFNIVVLGTAIVCALLYHSFRSENLGYLGFFAVYAISMFLFRDYINSGFYAVLNDTIDWASVYFNAEGFQYYNERISNRYAAVTVAACIIGIAMNVLLNNYILRRARYIVAIGLALTVNVLAFYMEREPDTFYTILVLFGILMTFFLKCGSHFYLSRRDHIYARMKQGITYQLDFKSLWQGIVIALCYIVIVVTPLSVAYNKDFYDAYQEDSEYKAISRDEFQNFITLGFWGLIDHYPNNGGLSTGELGGVAAIRLDYMTDITVLYTPYSLDTLYIKNFTGEIYMPYTNKWTETGIKKKTYAPEVNALKKAYENGDPHSAQGYMTITNVEAPAAPYQPYYSDGETEPIFFRNNKTYTYYPRFEDSTVTIENYQPESIYLDVPGENKETIDNFIEEAGFEPGDTMDVVNQVKEYYVENIPYTIRPGATPWRADFINYFLTDNRKGYCAHFASAATLIFREMGIPARYCEGYAISFNQMTLYGELVEDADYSNYYDGYNPLGETALVRMDVTDANAHAWVEVYVKDRGWVPVEVTPPSGIDEEETSDNFWDSFNNIFGDGDENNSDRDSGLNTNVNISAADKVMRVIAFVIIGILFLAASIFIFMKIWPSINYKIQYSKAGLSDKLILRYSLFVKKKRKKDPRFRTRMSYEEQMDYLIGFSVKGRDRMVEILNRAGFSRHEISQGEFNFAMSMLDDFFKRLAPILE